MSNNFMLPALFLYGTAKKAKIFTEGKIFAMTVCDQSGFFQMKATLRIHVLAVGINSNDSSEKHIVASELKHLCDAAFDIHR